MCVGENGHRHEYSAPPTLIRKDVIAQMGAEIGRLSMNAIVPVTPT